MKILIVILSILLLSMNSYAQDNVASEQDVEVIDSDIMERVNSETSDVVWVGKKVAGQHTGTIKIQSGELFFDASDNLISGEIKIDMTTITCTDLEGDDKAELEGHLSSEDFFGTEKFPVATLVITDVKVESENNFNVIAELSIKDVTETIQFTASRVEDEIIAQIVIDRTKYGIKYGSGSFFDDLGDKTINDEFDLLIGLRF